MQTYRYKYIYIYIYVYIHIHILDRLHLRGKEGMYVCVNVYI